MSAVLSCVDCRAAWQKTRNLWRDFPASTRRQLMEVYFAEYHRLGHDANQIVQARIEEVATDLGKRSIWPRSAWIKVLEEFKAAGHEDLGRIMAMASEIGATVGPDTLRFMVRYAETS